MAEVRFTAAGARDRETGLLGWLTFLVGGWLRVDGATLRRTWKGHLTISYPAREDRNGDLHYLLRPINDDARREVERQVFASIAGEVT